MSAPQTRDGKVWFAWMYPLVQGVRVSDALGYDVRWVGLHIGPIAVGIMWKSKREGRP